MQSCIFFFRRPKLTSLFVLAGQTPSLPLPPRPPTPSVFIGVEARRDRSSSINKLAWASSEPTEAQSFHRPFTWSRLAGRLEAALEASAGWRGKGGGVALLRKGGTTRWGGKEMFGLIINRPILFSVPHQKAMGANGGKKNNKPYHAAFKVPFFPTFSFIRQS